MRRDSLRSLGGTVVAILLYAATVAAAEANLPGPDSTAKELVDAALASELNGPSDLRPALLKQALERDPNFAPARWQSGYVRYDNQWLTLDEVARRVAADQQLTEYRKRRDALIDRADDHRALAQWCHKQKLADLERIHWAKVLEFNAQDAEAIAGLGLQLFEGRLLTPKQLEAAKQRAIEGRQALKHWQPQMVKWRKAIGAGRGPECTAALEALDKLNDPDAIPALEATFAENVASKKNDEMNVLLIETVGRMHSPEATETLLRRALVPDSQQVREAAADELKKRPMITYVPQLIAMLPGWVKTRYSICILPTGNVAAQAEMFGQKGESEYHLSYDFLVDIRWVEIFNRQRNAIGGINVAAELAQAARIISPVLAVNAAESQRNQVRSRVELVLRRATGFADVDNPELWLRRWNAYNETYTPISWPRQISEGESGTFSRVTLIIDPSCFPAGTPVVASTGSTPIEKIKVGDRVLAQNPATGELDYKTVQGVTLRPAVPLVQIHTGSQSVSATRGHPFWVNGEGWLLAKQLKVGQVLHSLAGAVVIDAIEELPAREAYNLVVSDFDSYFVGENHLLVHDNMPLMETAARVPGLNQQAAVP